MKERKKKKRGKQIKREKKKNAIIKLMMEK